MIKIDEALALKVRGVTELIENEINFDDLVKIAGDHVNFFENGITAAAALILFEKDRQLIWEQTKHIDLLWGRADSNDFTKICLVKAALVGTCQSYVAQYKEKRTKETVTISRGIKPTAKITISRYRENKGENIFSNAGRE